MDLVLEVHNYYPKQFIKITFFGNYALEIGVV